MLVGVDLDRLVGQHHRDAVVDPLRPLQARVVQEVLVGEIPQALLVDRAGEDLQKARIEAHGVK